MKKAELKIIQDFYDFMLWMIKHIEKYPRHHRYSLGYAMENRMQKILELFLRAKYRKEKRAMLDRRGNGYYYIGNSMGFFPLVIRNRHVEEHFSALI